MRDRKIIEALGLVWLFTGRIVVSDEGVTWVHITATSPQKLPDYTTRIPTEFPYTTYLTRTYLSMTGAQRRAIQQAEREYRGATRPPLSERLLGALVYSWLVPLAYGVARLVDRIKHG